MYSSKNEDDTFRIHNGKINLFDDLLNPNPYLCAIFKPSKND